MAYTEEFKRNFINEFLERYKKDPTLSLRLFGIEKLGKVTSVIYLWLDKYDDNKIYKVNKTKGFSKKTVAIATPSVVKVIKNGHSSFSVGHQLSQCYVG